MPRILKGAVMATAYELYIMPACPYCHKVQRYMNQRGIELPLHDITKEPEARATLERIGGKVQVPCLFIDGIPMYESDDIIAYFDRAFSDDIATSTQKLTVEDNAIRLVSPDGSVLAEVTFPTCDEGVVEIDHTFVDSSLRGQGTAGKLLDACVHELERTGRRARPTCSYAVRWLEKHPEWARILA